jgi:drug/metabolite transporter (DMT)-like permease
MFLVAAYRQGELGQIYPIVRGIVPLLVTLGGFLFAGQHLAPVELGGVVLLAIGVMSLAFGSGHATWSSIGYAVATGVLIATYGTIDAVGVRAGGSAATYTAWILIVYGALLPIAFFAVRRRISFNWRDPDFGKALLAGLFAVVAYGIIILAFTMGPAGPITALRETSVVFAALIGWLFLKEKLTPQRIAACVVVAVGAILIGW